MLVIKLELWPYGNQYKARELGRMYVINVSKHDDLNVGDYSVEVTTQDAEPKFTEVKNHPRLTAPVWTLIKKALDHAGY